MSHKHQFLAEQHEAPDQWHRHSSEEGMPQHEHAAKVNILGASAGLIFIVGFVALTIGLTWLYFNHYINKLKSEVGETAAVMADFNAYRTSAETRLLDGYAWVDPKSDTVSIPIDQAMDKVLAKYAGGRSGAEGVPATLATKEGDGH